MIWRTGIYRHLKKKNLACGWLTWCRQLTGAIFFHTWELRGLSEDFFTTKKHGEEAYETFCRTRRKLARGKLFGQEKLIQPESGFMDSFG